MKDLIEIHITFDEPIEDDEAERVGGRAVALIVKRLGHSEELSATGGSGKVACKPAVLREREREAVEHGPACPPRLAASRSRSAAEDAEAEVLVGSQGETPSSSGEGVGGAPLHREAA